MTSHLAQFVALASMSVPVLALVAISADAHAAVAALTAALQSSLLSSQVLFVALGVLAVALLAYAGLSIFVARRLAYPKPLPIRATPGDLGLDFRDVAFTSRGDGKLLRGWIVPGIDEDGTLSLERTIVAVHGLWQNRTDPAQGLNDLVCALARAGYAVLAFDMRGHGESDPAPFTLGDVERNDVLGAVDFLRNNVLPYPKLARPRWIGAWGVSIGAHAVLFAAAEEPAIEAVVADSAYAEMGHTLARELPKQSKLPALFTRGILLTARTLYDVDGYAVRPVEAVARIAPRPVLFIQGGADTMNQPATLVALVAAAQAAPDAHVASWQPEGVDHAQAFHADEQAYVGRVAAFFAAAAQPQEQPVLPDAASMPE